MIKSAIISDCGMYRYELRRIWGPAQKLVCFIGLNPSSADAESDDPTIRRCIGFARSWGYDGLIMVNLFAYRTAHPTHLRNAQARGIDIVGAMNGHHFDLATREAALVIAAWGADRKAKDQSQLVLSRLCVPLHAIALSKETGAPRHPLYLKANSTPVIYTP